MPRYAASIQYSGYNFYGWQKLRTNLPTVQSVVEEALSKVANHKLEVICAGRTDARVHALNQIIHFDSDANRTSRNWLHGANINLPDEVAINWIQAVDSNFHARFSALWRSYRYIIYNNQIRPVHFAHSATRIYNKLDHNLMQQGANFLIGKHDFNSFRASQCQAKSSVRNLYELRVKRIQDIIIIDVKANAFLHHMVRNIVGALIAVGSQKYAPEWIKQVLVAQDRTKSDVTAPAYGLYFVTVGYGKDFALPEYNYKTSILDTLLNA